MKSPYFFLFILIFIGEYAMTDAQPKISRIRIVGAEAFSENNLTDNFKPLGYQIADTSRISTGISNLEEEYFSQGYFLIRLDSSRIQIDPDSSEATLILFLHEGPRLLVGEILTEGNEFYSRSDLLSDFNTIPGRTFNQGELEDDINFILKKYNDSGFPLARIRIDSIFIYGGNNTDSLGVALRIEEGKRVKIEAVRVEGNTKTKDYVIIRALKIPANTYYSEDEIQSARQRLLKLGFFQTVDEPEIFASGDTTGLLVKVAEGNTSTFDGVIGYVPSQVGQSGYFTGMIDISISNLFGTGRKFRAMWHQETNLTQELEVGYAEPYIFDSPVNAEFDFSQRQQDTTSVTRNLAATGTFTFSDNFNANLSVGNLSTTPLLNANNNYFVYESSILNLGAGITYDTRDDIYSPRYGVLYQTQFQLGLKKIYGPAQLINQNTRLSNYTQHLSVDLSFFHELFPRQIVALGFHGAQVTGTELDQTDMYRLGGTNTIRGYIENQFIATRAAWTSIEYRFASGRESYFFTFLDAGYIYRQSDPVANVPQIILSVYGYGVGAQVETGIGILKASYALGRGDSFVEGKIHFGIVNQF